MKTIALMPVKNEAWVLKHTLKNIVAHVDLVIIADQNSTDETVAICNQFDNVQILTNPYTGHSNKVRWLLLDEARKYGDNNLIFCLDADEVISPLAITEIKQLIENKKAIPGDVFKSKWIQLWKSSDKYMEEGVWKNNYKNIAFIDNRSVNEYKRDIIINDHTSRVPDSLIRNEIIISYPFLHLNFIDYDRNQLKQAWYRCTELIKGSRSARRINNTYRVTILENVSVYPVPSRWVTDLDLPLTIKDTGSNWYHNEIIGFFNQYGILFFENLQIWHIPELHKQFIQSIGREPKIKTFPGWLSKLNDIKNYIRNNLVKNDTKR